MRSLVTVMNVCNVEPRVRIHQSIRYCTVICWDHWIQLNITRKMAFDNQDILGNEMIPEFTAITHLPMTQIRSLKKLLSDTQTSPFEFALIFKVRSMMRSSKQSSSVFRYLTDLVLPLQVLVIQNPAGIEVGQERLAWFALEFPTSSWHNFRPHMWFSWNMFDDISESLEFAAKGQSPSTASFLKSLFRASASKVYTKFLWSVKIVNGFSRIRKYFNSSVASTTGKIFFLMKL